MSRNLDRYHRQMLLPGFGEEGQRRLLESTAVVLGCGALGSVAADMLARAGVGRLVIIDRDFIEPTNLQRQVLYDEQDVADGLPKAEAARRKLGRINSQIQVHAVVDDLNHTNIERHARGAGVLVDGLDNFETRYLANDCAVKHGVPYVYGGAVGTAGMVFTVLPHSPEGDSPWEMLEGGSRASPCLRCLFPEAPAPGEAPTCDTAGVLGPAAALIANCLASEALKILSGNFGRVSRSLLNVDLWTNELMQLDVGGARDLANCPCCRLRNFEYLDGKAGSSATVLCGHDAVQLTHLHDPGSLNLADIGSRLRRHGAVTVNEFLLRAELADQGRAFELVLFANGRAIVRGTGEPQVARGIYAKYIGS